MAYNGLWLYRKLWNQPGTIPYMYGYLYGSGNVTWSDGAEGFQYEWQSKINMLSASVINLKSMLADCALPVNNTGTITTTAPSVNFVEYGGSDPSTQIPFVIYQWNGAVNPSTPAYKNPSTNSETLIYLINHLFLSAQYGVQYGDRDPDMHRKLPPAPMNGVLNVPSYRWLDSLPKKQKMWRHNYSSSPTIRP